MLLVIQPVATHSDAIWYLSQPCTSDGAALFMSNLHLSTASMHVSHTKKLLIFASMALLWSYKEPISTWLKNAH